MELHPILFWFIIWAFLFVCFGGAFAALAAAFIFTGPPEDAHDIDMNDPGPGTPKR